jgi:hypothetical protein
MSSPGEFDDTRDYLRHFWHQPVTTLDDAHLPWPSVIAVTAPELVGRHSPYPYVTFNAIPATMIRNLQPMSLPDAQVSHVSLLGSASWHDPSIATFWHDSDEAIAVWIKYKQDWYEQADVERLWQVVSGVLSEWSSLARDVPRS